MSYPYPPPCPRCVAIAYGDAAENYRDAVADGFPIDDDRPAEVVILEWARSYVDPADVGFADAARCSHCRRIAAAHEAAADEDYDREQAVTPYVLMLAEGDAARRIRWELWLDPAGAGAASVLLAEGVADTREAAYADAVAADPTGRIVNGAGGGLGYTEARAAAFAALAAQVQQPAGR